MNKTLYLLLCMVFVVGWPFPLSAQIINTIAGNGGTGFSGDGMPAVTATFNSPSCIAVDAAGNIYISDQLNNRIRKVSTSGIITTIAGTGTAAYFGDGGPATLAKLSSNWGLAIDATGNLYIADQNNNVVRKVNTSGIISTIAGNNVGGFSGDGGPATAAQLLHPIGVAVDGAGNVYIGDRDNWRIRMVNSSGIISTIAGSGTIPSFSGDGGPAISARLGYTFGLSVDGFGNLFICDASNNRIRKINSSGIISTVVGDGTPGYSADGIPAATAELNNPTGVFASSSGDIYIADYDNHRIRKVNTSGIINTIAGTGTPGFSGDGDLATDAKLSHPLCVTVDGSNSIIYLTDYDNVRIRMISNRGVVTFSGGKTQTLTVCENSVANSINSQMAVLDHDVGHPDTWAILSGPPNGTAFVSYSAIATGSTYTPSGLYYTPDGSFSGNDSFTVTVNDGIGADTTTIYVTVDPVLPSPGAITGASNVCVGSSISLAETVTGGTWSTANASATINDGIVTGIYAGTNTIIYTVSNPCGSSSITKVISVNPLPDPGVISGVSTMCMGSSVTLTDTVSGGIWSAANLRASVNPIANGSIVTGLSKGRDTILYNVTNTLCQASASFVVNIDTFPDAGVINGPPGVCIGSQISVEDTTSGGTWHISNGNASLSDGIVTGVTMGIDTVSYSISNTCGTATAMQPIIVKPLPDQPIITQRESVLSVPPGYTTYQWHLNGNNITGAVVDTYVVAVTGQYDVTVTNTYGCSAAAATITGYGCSTDDIIIYPNPSESVVYINWCKKVDVRIICMDGKVLKPYYNTSKIDLGDLPNGTYMLSIFDTNGIKIKTKRIVKLTE